jgi:RecA-family ATPase
LGGGFSASHINKTGDPGLKVPLPGARLIEKGKTFLNPSLINKIKEHIIMKEEVQRFINFLNYGDDPFEVTIINPQKKTSDLWEGEVHGKGLVTGYFDDPEKVVSLLPKLNKLKAEGVYVSLNKVQKDLLNQAKNKFRPHISRTKDDQIPHINNMVIDIDPIRESKKPADQAEQEKALEVSDEIRKEFKKYGLPKPMVVSTGNGVQLFLKANMKNTEDRKRLVKDFLAALGNKFNSSEVKVDAAVGNPARLVRLPGTFNRKGTATPGRPHRKAEVVFIPKNFKRAKISRLKKLIDAAGLEKRRKEPVVNLIGHKYDLEAYFDHYHINISRTKEYRRGRIYVLEKCIFNSSHTPDEASIIEAPNGKLYYQCFHDSCKGKTWKKARMLISGGDSLKPFSLNVVSAVESPLSGIKIVSAAEMMSQKREPEPAVFSGLLEKTGNLLVLGTSGIGKSILALNMALNAAKPPQDQMLWGLFKIPQPVNTLIIQSENGINFQLSRLQLMVKENQRFKDASQSIFFPMKNKDCRLIANLNDDNFIDKILGWVYKYDTGLIIFDPLISYHDESENENRAMRKVLDKVTRLNDLGQVATAIVHHTGKSDASRLSGGRGASSIGDWATSIIGLEETKEEGPGILKVTHTKCRNFQKANPFFLEMTPGLQYDRHITSKDGTVPAVLEVLKSLGGTAKNQKELIEAVMKKTGEKKSTARRHIEEAEKKGLIQSIPAPKKGMGKAYQLVEDDSDE